MNRADDDSVSKARRRAEEDAELLKASREGDAMRILGALAGGASPTASGDGGKTALHLAAERGNGTGPECAMLLLAAGADPLATDDDGATPLHLAAASPWEGDESCAKVLIESGPPAVKARDKKGRTPLVCLAGSKYDADADGDFLRMLLEAGRTRTRRTTAGRLPCTRRRR